MTSAGRRDRLQQHGTFVESMRTTEERYGADNVDPWDDWGWGFIYGELSALRWVLGED